MPLFYVWKKMDDGTFGIYVRALRAKDGETAIKKAVKKSKDARHKVGEFVARPSGLQGYGASSVFLTI